MRIQNTKNLNSLPIVLTSGLVIFTCLVNIMFFLKTLLFSEYIFLIGNTLPFYLPIYIIKSFLSLVLIILITVGLLTLFLNKNINVGKYILLVAAILSVVIGITAGITFLGTGGLNLFSTFYGTLTNSSLLLAWLFVFIFDKTDSQNVEAKKVNNIRFSILPVFIGNTGNFILGIKNAINRLESANCQK